MNCGLACSPGPLPPPPSLPANSCVQGATVINLRPQYESAQFMQRCRTKKTKTAESLRADTNKKRGNSVSNGYYPSIIEMIIKLGLFVCLHWKLWVRFCNSNHNPTQILQTSYFIKLVLSSLKKSLAEKGLYREQSLC